MAGSLKNRNNTSRLHHRSGVVLVMTLLSLVLLVGLIFYVYNLSQQVNSRLALQQSADAAAISGSTWMARSMNQVAMNNVAQTKLLASVVVLDSLPLATELGLNDASAWADALNAQCINLPRSSTSAVGVSAREREFLRLGLMTLRDRMVRQRDILDAMHESLKDFPMERLTYYAEPGQSGGPYGELWRGAVALTELSQATALSSGVLAQNNAVRWGMESDVTLRTAFLTPIRPTMPATLGRFADFGYPLAGRENVFSDSAALRSPWRAGRGGNVNPSQGGSIPDMVYPYRLGPWARLHRWRDPLYSQMDGEWIPGTRQVRSADDSGPSGPAGRRAQSNQGGGTQWQGVEIGYRTYGPLEWALRRMDSWAQPWTSNNGRAVNGELDVTRFGGGGGYMRRLCNDKLRYMFYDSPPRTIHKPRWIWPASYDRAHAQASANPGQVHEVTLFVIEIVSSVPQGSQGWLSGGTYRVNVPASVSPVSPDDPDHRPYRIDVPNASPWQDAEAGWPDPDKWGLTKVGNHIWRDDYYFWTTSDPEIGIQLQRDALGEPIYQKVYVRSFYVWGGIDVGSSEEVGNPCNWSDDAVLPAPLLLVANPFDEEGDYNPTTLDPDVGYRRRYFTFLGAAQMNTPPLVMNAFGTGSPSGRTVAFAQAKVFNPSSFDLWTQDWQAAMMPVTRMDDWLERMRTDAHQTTATNGLLTADAVMDVHEHIRRLGADLVREQTKH